ncbi:Uncharacterized protein TCM_005871 [Theobroma cacao]|uniref:Uncharacterized protein n=1 Tax=Theobroma cacao TaxID=3641 RepID=A0A061DXB0_THECC|nr:Uncharacterized protein TCM_005871 [Theobroma cacao]
MNGSSDVLSWNSSRVMTAHLALLVPSYITFANFVRLIHNRLAPRPHWNFFPTLSDSLFLAKMRLTSLPRLFFLWGVKDKSKKRWPEVC